MSFISWTFDDFTTPGTVATVELNITAVDALDLSASAKQKILATAQGAYLKIEGGNIELHAPGNTMVVYCFRMTNTGSVDLDLQSLVDSHLGSLALPGGTIVMPGQSFRLPFGVAADYQFACTAHASGQMTIVVDAAPTGAWARLRWRVRRLLGV